MEHSIDVRSVVYIVYFMHMNAVWQSLYGCIIKISVRY